MSINKTNKQWLLFALACAMVIMTFVSLYFPLYSVEITVATFNFTLSGNGFSLMPEIPSEIASLGSEIEDLGISLPKYDSFPYLQVIAVVVSALVLVFGLFKFQEKTLEKSYIYIGSVCIGFTAFYMVEGMVLNGVLNMALIGSNALGMTSVRSYSIWGFIVVLLLFIGHLIVKKCLDDNFSFATILPHSNGSKKVDPSSELLRFKQLLDSGVITQEEFDDQKKKILNS